MDLSQLQLRLSQHLRDVRRVSFDGYGSGQVVRIDLRPGTKAPGIVVSTTATYEMTTSDGIARSVDDLRTLVARQNRRPRLEEARQLVDELGTVLVHLQEAVAEAAGREASRWPGMAPGAPGVFTEDLPNYPGLWEDQ